MNPTEDSVIYGSFGRRIGAALIDFMILVLLISPWLNLYPRSKTTFLILAFLSQITHLVYHIYFHAKFGQTFGKMVTRIELRTVDFQTIDFARAVRRSSIEIVLSSFALLGLCIATFQADLHLVQNANWIPLKVFFNPILMAQLSDFQNQFKILDPTAQVFGTLSLIWISAEFLTMLFNKKSRALHDFIGGTVVIQSPTMNVKNYDFKGFYIYVLTAGIILLFGINTAPQLGYFALPSMEREEYSKILFSKETQAQMLCSEGLDQCSPLTNEITVDDDILATRARAFASHKLQYFDKSVNELSEEQIEILLKYKKILPTPHEIFSSYLERRFSIELKQPTKLAQGVDKNKNAFESLYELLETKEHIEFFSQNPHWKSLSFDRIPYDIFELAGVTDGRDFICIGDGVSFSSEVKTNWDSFFKNVNRRCRR